MEALLFLALTGLSAWMILSRLRFRTVFMEVPVLVAAVFLGWVVPQLWQVRQYEGADPSLTTLYLFCIGCLLATLMGWRWGIARARRSTLDEALTYKNLTTIAIVFTAIGWAMALLIGAQSLEDRTGKLWSGRITIMYFFSNLKIIGLFLSAYLFLRKPTPIAIALLGANVLIYVPVLLIAFRRRAFLEVATCGLLAFWFARRAIVPRLAVIAAMPLGMLVVFAVGRLRHITLSDGGRYITFSDLMSIDWLSYNPIAGGDTAPEMFNAFTIVSRFGFSDYTLGAMSWDRIVFQWVPAQIVGRDLKDALSFQALDLRELIDRIGSTPTAMGEAWMEFGPLGVMFFFATAAVMGWWWIRANSGDSVAMLLYAAGLAPAVLMPTAYAIYFFNTMLLYGAAIIGVAYVVRRMSGAGKAKRRRAPPAAARHRPAGLGAPPPGAARLAQGVVRRSQD